jgi:hypothetical protein
MTALAVAAGGPSNIWSIGGELGLDRGEAAALFEYLKDAGLAEYRAGGGRGRPDA